MSDRPESSMHIASMTENMFGAYALGYGGTYASVGPSGGYGGGYAGASHKRSSRMTPSARCSTSSETPPHAAEHADGADRGHAPAPRCHAAGGAHDTARGREVLSVAQRRAESTLQRAQPRQPQSAAGATQISAK